MKFYLTKAAQRAAEAQESGKPAPVTTRSASKGPKGGSARTGAQDPRGSEVARASKSRAPKRRAEVKNSPIVRSEVILTSSPQPEAPAEVPAVSRKEKKPLTVRAGKKGVLPIGGEPRVDLLPPEVRAERRSARMVGRAWFGVGVLVVLAVIAAGGSSLYAGKAASSLALQQTQLTHLSVEKAKYDDVETLKSQVSLVRAGQLVGGSADIDWNDYLTGLQNSLPAGVELYSLDVSSATPQAAFAQATDSLEGSRAATITFSVTSSSLTPVHTWLATLTGLKGYVDLTPQSVSVNKGVFTTTVALHLNQKAFSGLYTPKGK